MKSIQNYGKQGYFVQNYNKQKTATIFSLCTEGYNNRNRRVSTKKNTINDQSVETNQGFVKLLSSIIKGFS